MITESPRPNTPPEQTREESPEFLFNQAIKAVSESFEQNALDSENNYMLASIAYSLLGITKQLDFIRMEMERMRQQYNDR